MKRTSTRSPIGRCTGLLRGAWLLAGAGLIAGATVQAQCDPDVPYSGNFSDAAIPACYTVVDANADTRTWRGWTATGFVNNSVALYDGWGIDTPEDYLITPGLNTLDGHTYQVSFNYNNPLVGTSFPCGLRVWYGDAPTAAAMTNAIGDLGMVTSGAVTSASFEFTPGAGPAYIGFEVYNPDGSAYTFQVGDIEVISLGGPSGCTAEDIPYTANFSDSTLPDCYTVIDANADGYSWIGWDQVGYDNPSVANYHGQGGGEGELAPDDWLITMGLNTEAATTYRLTFKYRNGFAAAPVGLRVLAGANATVAGMDQLLEDLGLLSATTPTEVTIDFTPGAGPVHIGFHVLGHSAGWNMGMRVGDISVVALTGCALDAPTGLDVSAVTSTGAYVEWNSVAGAFDYAYEVRSSGAAGSGAAGLVASGYTANTFADLAGLLTPNTGLVVYVRARCAADEPSDVWSSGVAFSTPCDVFGLPYAEDFTAANSFDCFTSQNTTTPPDDGFPYWFRATTNWSAYGFTGASAAIFHGGGNPDAWLFLPPVELDGGTEYRLSYLYGKAGNFNNTRFGALEVWYGTATDGGDVLANGVQLADHGAFNHAAQAHALTFTPPSAGTYFIALRCNSNFYSGTYTVVDDLLLELAPSCAQPLSVTANAAGDGLSVSWSCDGCTGDFLVEYGLAANFTTPGTDATAGTNGTIASTGATSPFSITDLVPGETYRVFVRQLCGAEYSENSIAVTGTTGLPNTSCFDAIDLECGTTASANTTPAPLQVNGLCDATTADTYGVWYAVTGDGGDFTLSTCAVDGGSAAFSTRISVFTSDDCANFTCVANSTQPTGCGSVTWATVPEEYYLVYVSGHSGSGERGNFTIALECAEPPTCLPPVDLAVSGVTASDAVLNWTNSAFNPGNDHVYELRTSGAPGSGPTGLVASGSSTSGIASFDVLTGSVTYTFSVRADCGDGDLSSWTSVTFTTPCAAANIPYDAAFASGAIPACYTVVNANNDDFTWVGATLPGFTNTSVAVYNNFDGHSFVPNDWLITQALNTTAGTNYRVSLKHRLSLAFANGAVGLQVYAGPTADPADMVLIEDLGDVATSAVTLREVDFTASGGPLYIGFKAGANVANTGWSFALYLGDIKVDLIDCEGTLNGSALPGTACNDGDPDTENDTWNADCECVGTPVSACTNDLVVEFTTDANGAQIGWGIEPLAGGTAVCGGEGLPGNAVITVACCLPDGCYRLVVTDAGGDGIAGGGYVLRTVDGDRIIDNSGNFSTGSVSAVADGFCLPLGDDRPIHTSCDRTWWQSGNYLVATENAAVSAQFGVSNTTSGYEFWFFDPNGGLSFRKFRNHATSDGFAPNNAVRAAHIKLNNWAVANHLQENVLYNVRIRGVVAGEELAFGPACRVVIDPVAAACTPTGLNDIPGHANFSCGVSRVFGGANSAANRVYARSVAGANRYEFEFSNPGEGYLVSVFSNTVIRHLNWTSQPGLNTGSIYQVRVRASKDGGATWCNWGWVCDVTIAPNVAPEGESFAALGQTEVALWPNPNNGQQFFFTVDGMNDEVRSIAIDIHDLSGKRVVAREVAAQHGAMHVELGGIANGTYVVTITAGDQRAVQRLVIAQ